jgi:hypothetical protein
MSFDITSPTLQNTIIIAFARRQYRIVDRCGLLEDECIDLFIKDLNNHQKRLSNIHDPSMQRVHKENDELVKNYMDLWRRHAPVSLPFPWRQAEE